jgi:NAD(P) transhydrogenase subunit alpha
MNNTDILTLLTVFVLSAFVGFEVISKVPSVLHTPLMSGTNAIHGVVLVGSMAILGTAHGAIEITLGFIAVVLSTVNVVGGFVVTDRMLEMFKGRQPAPAAGGKAPGEAPSFAPLPEEPASPGPAPASVEPLPVEAEPPVGPGSEALPANQEATKEPGEEKGPGEPTQFLSPEDMPPPPFNTEATELIPRPMLGPNDTQVLRGDEEEQS